MRSLILLLILIGSAYSFSCPHAAVCHAVKAAEWYDGDEINMPVAPELNIKIPEGYCGALDFGTLQSGELALIEANSPYACGWYGRVGSGSSVYVEWLISGWNYLNR
jgi:hypothetical protein